MQLELKHLAAYLPYGVRVLTTINIEGRPVIGRLNAYSISDILDTYIGERLILRPMSDLTKEIEHNREKFVPIEWLNSNKSVTLVSGRYTNGNEVVFNTRVNSSNIRFWEYCIIEKLLSWHFDIFKLIPSGLAVDVNEI